MQPLLRPRFYVKIATTTTTTQKGRLQAAATQHFVSRPSLTDRVGLFALKQCHLAASLSADVVKAGPS